MSVSQPCCSLQCCSSFLPESGQKMGGCGSKEQSDSSFEGGRTANRAVVPAAAKQATSLPSADAAAVSQVPDISVRRAVLEPCVTPHSARCTSPSQSSEAHLQPMRHRLVQQTRAVASLPTVLMLRVSSLLRRARCQRSERKRVQSLLERKRVQSLLERKSGPSSGLRDSRG